MECEPESIVIDASVATKWFMPDEPHSVAALAIMAGCRSGKYKLHAPSIFIYETFGAISRGCAIRHGGKSRIELAEAALKVNELLKLPIQLHPPKADDIIKAM